MKFYLKNSRTVLNNCKQKNKSYRGTSFDGCELLRSNDEAEETVSSPEMICSFIYIDSFSEKEGDWEFFVGKRMAKALAI